MKRLSFVPRAFAAVVLFLSAFAGAAIAQEPAVDARALRREANAAVQKKDFATAAAAFKKLTDANPKDAQAWHMLGYSLHIAGKLDEALAAHREAAKFPATAGPATYNIACVYAMKHQSDDAFAWLDKAVAAGFDDVDLLRTDGDLASLREDPRFAKLVAAVAAAPKRANLQAFVQAVPRKNARIAWFGRDGSPAQIALDYSPVEWKADYEQKFASGAFRGKKWRLGSDFWTRLDTWVELRFGDVVVPAGYYYLTLEQRDADTVVLALHDPAAIRKQRIDGFQADQVKGGIEVPMKHGTSESVAASLDIALALQEGSQRDGELTIAFGGHRLIAPFRATVD